MPTAFGFFGQPIEEQDAGWEAEVDRLEKAEAEDRARHGGPISNGHIMTLLMAHRLEGVDVIAHNQSEMKTPTDEGGTLVGYCRVSTEDQNLGLQVDALARAGVAPNMIFTDKVSGVAKRRPGRDLAIRQCRPGDTLVVWKLDRISRSVLDLLTLLNGLEERGIKFKSLTDPIDTTGPMGRAVVTILGAVAQLERDLIRQRTQAGVNRAMERGVLDSIKARNR